MEKHVRVEENASSLISTASIRFEPVELEILTPPPVFAQPRQHVLEPLRTLDLNGLGARHADIDIIPLLEVHDFDDHRRQPNCEAVSHLATFIKTS